MDDFKSTLQAEIEAKKRQFSEKKSVKVSDLEKLREEEYFGKQRALDEQRQVINLVYLTRRFHF